MSLTFGAATTDSAVYTGQVTAVADNCSTLVAGWFYPTTLTLGRNYFGMGASPGISVYINGTTSSEIDVQTNNATTDGVWRTSGLGMVANVWQFLAVFWATENTTVPGQVRVWRGTEWTPPAAPTSVTNPTVRSGNYTGSTTRTIGNDAAGSSFAFQGDIAGITVIAVDAVGVNNPLAVATSGTLAAAEEQLIYDRWVFPLWQGTPDFARMRSVALSGNFELSYAPLDRSGLMYIYSNPNAAIATKTLTVSGATFTDNTPSRLPPADWVMRYLSRPRRRV